MDGSFDKTEVYILLKRMNINPIIKPRKDARIDKGSSERHRTTMLIKKLG